ncbi:MAG TPA: DUF1330 domain-containing protein [Rhizomicrobium sp.]
MAKGYRIARVDVSDAQAYGRYVEGTADAFAKCGATFLARGGRTAPLEGTARSRNVVIEFESLEQAVACHQSPEYQRARAHRIGAAEADLYIVEGVA